MRPTVSPARSVPEIHRPRAMRSTPLRPLPSTGMDATVETIGLTKRYGRTVAVDGLSIAVRPGCVTGFVGPNGAGKTTTMHLLLGLATADSGDALVQGQAVRDHSPTAYRGRGTPRRARLPPEPLGAEPPPLARPDERDSTSARGRRASPRGAREGRQPTGRGILARDAAASWQSRPRCSAIRRSSFSTSPRSDSTRKGSSGCARRCAGWQRRAAPCSSRATT